MQKKWEIPSIRFRDTIGQAKLAKSNLISLGFVAIVDLGALLVLGLFPVGIALVSVQEALMILIVFCLPGELNWLNQFNLHGKQ